MILLTTPFNPGDTEPGKQYTHARAETVNIRLSRKKLTVQTCYYYENDEGVLTPGAKEGPQISIDEADFYAAKRLKAKIQNGQILREYLKSIEQYLLDQEVFDGAVIDDPLLDDPPPIPADAGQPPDLRAKRSDPSSPFWDGSTKVKEPPKRNPNAPKSAP